ncbi:MAG: extracellular solute-binding protein [Clostridia bacterium]
MKKVLALVLAMLLLATMATSAVAEGTPIRWLSTGDAAAKAIEDGDRIIAAIDEKFGIDLTAQYVPENNVEKVNVAMASGDFPDIVTGYYGTSATQSWIDNSMVIPLNSYMDKYPNLKAWLESYSWSAIDGVYYGLPFITQYAVANALISMRKDWLDNLGLAYPTNLDEMKAVLTAFTTGDPDKNGQADTYGITGIKPIGNFNWAFYAYGRQYSDYGLNADGQIIPWFEDACFIPGMTYLKELWDVGVIDKEFVLNDQSKMEEKFYQGKVGAVPFPLYRNLTRHETNLKTIFPEASMVYGLPPVGPDGVSFGLNPQGRTGMMTCITAACKEPEKAIAFLDFMVSPEGNDLVRLGIPGVHYTKNADGTITYNMEERTKDSFADNGWAHPLAWGSLYWPLESSYMPETELNRERALETVALATQAQKPALVNRKTSLEIENGSALDDIYNQYFVDILQGKYTVEDGAKRLSEEWRSQGGEELLVELNTVYQASK